MLTWPALVGLLLAVQVPEAAQAPRAPRVVPPHPAAYEQCNGSTALTERGLQGSVYVVTERSVVRIRWQCARITEQVGCFQDLTTAFWPSAARWSGDTLIVAGSTRDWRTVIEQWSFDFIAAGPLRDGYAPPRTTRVLYDAPTDERGDLRLMYPLHHPADVAPAMLVQFSKHDDVYSLELATRRLQLALGAAQQPALAWRDWSYIWSAEHAHEGFLYIYEAGAHCLVGPPRRHLMLQDKDRDGRLDGALLLDDEQWMQKLGGDPSTPSWLHRFD